MAGLNDSCIDLTITSPPYDNQRKYNGFIFDFERTAKNLFRITNTGGGVLVWVVGDQTVNGSESGSSFRQALYFINCGFKLHDTMIYRKLNFIPTNHNRYEQEFEYMFVFVKGKLKTFNPLRLPCKYAGTFYRGNPSFYNGTDHLQKKNKKHRINDYKNHGNIFEYNTGSLVRNGKTHPAIFPEQLAADHITTWSNIGDLVFDPFSGSGTTCAEAKRVGRRFLGCDISQEYVDDANAYIAKIQDITDIL